MPRNILIFSDGTGARGGIFVDERRSNIYKLYRATRCGPDSSVNPAKQVAFYNPGIGTSPPGSGTVTTFYRKVYNLVSAALGLGLTRNIVECYAAIVRLYRPGDRIFLFGFSRGAYTVRCLGAVIALCGVPTRSKDGEKLRTDLSSSKKIAREAVKKVYQHTSSWRTDDPRDAGTERLRRRIELLDQRRELARRFREAYGSADGDKANAYPYFIGVFDTVASLSNPTAVVGLAGLCAAGFVGIALLWKLLGLPGAAYWSLPDWIGIAVILTYAVVAVGLFLSIGSRVKWETHLPRRNSYQLFHFAEARMNFYDNQLNPNVSFAKHAISIDEARSSFQRVPWGDPKADDESGKADKNWFEQVWFPGNHSDVGGSYPENEARLSDISLHWMLEAAVGAGLLYDPDSLKLFPDPLGPLHDETRSNLIFRLARKRLRRVRRTAVLHPSVEARLKATDVLNYNVWEPYRPENLRDHGSLGVLFAPHAPSGHSPPAYDTDTTLPETSSKSNGSGGPMNS